MYKYSLEKIRNKAYKAGYRVSKGFQHYMYNGAVVKDCNGLACTGFNVEDLTTGTLVWGCYDANYDHLWTLEDIESFLKTVYKENGLEY